MIILLYMALMALAVYMILYTSQPLIESLEARSWGFFTLFLVCTLAHAYLAAYWLHKIAELVLG